MEITFRQTDRSDGDAAFLSWGLNAAADGLMDLMMGKQRDRILSNVCRIPGHDLSLERAAIAETGGQRAGILMDMAAETMVDPFPVIRKSAGFRVLRILFFGVPAMPILRATMRHDPGEWYIQALAVSPDFRGKGIGTQLLSLAEKRAREHGAATLALDVASDNAGGIRLYSRFGFETQYTSPPARLLNNIRLHRMTKRL